MAGSDSSKNTQEEKPQRDSVEDQYETTDWPSCLKLDVLMAKNNEDPKGNVLLSCMKMPNVKDPGEKPTCPSYTCVSGLTQRHCSTINFIQTYQPIQCSKAGQKLQQKLQQKSHKCWTKSTEDFKDIDLCCLPEVLEKATLEMEKLPVLKREIQKRTSWNRKIMKALTGDTNPHPTTTLDLKMNIKHKLRSQKD